MDWHILRKSDFGSAISRLHQKMDIFVPFEIDNDIRFRSAPINDPLSPAGKKPLLPLKTLFFPETESLFSIEEKKETTILSPALPFKRAGVVIGALACDIQALEILDTVLLKDPIDDLYQQRREQTIIVAQVCTEEGPECFCTSLGINPSQPSGADIIMADIGDAYLIKVLSEKGQSVKKILFTLLRKPSARELSGFSRHSPARQRQLSLPDLPLETNKIWDMPIWKELASRCLGCGICTVLCPTCHCFDVQDERRGSSAKRFRSWDSCMNTNFTKMASGENPRPTTIERLRQRFLHKLCYFPLLSARIACVGCGRCSVFCPVGIGIEEPIVELSEKEKSGE